MALLYICGKVVLTRMVQESKMLENSWLLCLFL